MKRLLSCLMAFMLAVMPLLAIAEGTEGQDMSKEDMMAMLAALLVHPELGENPEINTWYRVTPENALTATGEQWHGLFKKGSENKVMIYFYGGGVSVDNHSAANPDEFYNTNGATDGLESLGIAVPNEENPFGNWSVCVIPYVNGDFHCGTGEFDFDEDGKSGTVLHHGWTNYTLLMDQVMPYIGTPDAVLITGFSAGGFGTALNANDTFTRYFPDTENLTVFVDSSLLVSEKWHDIAENVWRAPESIVNRLVTGDLVLDSLKALREDHPTCRILFGCSTRDGALASVQNYLDNGVNDAGKEEGDVFQENLTAFVKELTEMPNTAVFIWSGMPYDDTHDPSLTSHTIESFPTVFIPLADGLSIAQWVSEGVNGNLTNHGIELLEAQAEASSEEFTLADLLALLGQQENSGTDQEGTGEGEFSLEDLQALMEMAQYQHDHYYELAQPELPLESLYTPLGDHEVACAEYDAQDEALQKIEIWYPAGLADESYPVVIMVNGTGILASQYQSVFRHLASWGFVVVGNEDPSSGTGAGTEKTLQFVLSLNENEADPFYGKLDAERIGLCGHSQGGAGVFSALTLTEHGTLYKTAVSLSPTHEETAWALGWPYELDKITVPTLMLAGTAGDFETQLVIPYEKMIAMYEKISAPKAMARRIGTEHGDMLYNADAYVTAWFMWQLKGDEQAAAVFTGDAPELLANPQYQDQRIDVGGYEHE